MAIVLKIINSSTVHVMKSDDNVYGVQCVAVIILTFKLTSLSYWYIDNSFIDFLSIFVMLSCFISRLHKHPFHKPFKVKPNIYPNYSPEIWLKKYTLHLCTLHQSDNASGIIISIYNSIPKSNLLLTLTHTKIVYLIGFLHVLLWLFMD